MVVWKGNAGIPRHAMPQSSRHFATPTLAPEKRRYANLDNEALAIVFGVKVPPVFVQMVNYDHKLADAPVKQVASNTPDALCQDLTLGSDTYCIRLFHCVTSG